MRRDLPQSLKFKVVSFGGIIWSILYVPTADRIKPDSAAPNVENHGSSPFVRAIYIERRTAALALKVGS